MTNCSGVPFVTLVQFWRQLMVTHQAWIHRV